MSTKLQNDMEYANSILNNECNDPFRKIYTNTNEDLLELFNKLNLAGKDVFSVLSSSDYLYMSYLFGAKNVNSFDINPLTYRYFYLRKWLIKNNITDIGILSPVDLLEIIENTKIDCLKDEKESLIFWRDVLTKMPKSSFYNPLFISTFTPFSLFYREKWDDFFNIVSSINPNFYNFDLCAKSALDTNKKYDYVFISNILDYNRKKERMENAVNNLMNLTTNNGKVICAHIPAFINEDFSQELELEKSFFQDSFKYSKISSSRIGSHTKFYQYTRK